MTSLLYILPLVLLIRILNSYRVKIATLTAENKVSEQRNLLYLAALEGKVDTKNSAFLSVDRMIEGAGRSLQKINIWVPLYLSFINKRPFNKTEIAQSVMLKEGTELNAFYNAYSEIYLNYLLKKNIFYLFITFLVMHASKHFSKGLNSWIQKQKDNFKYQLLSNNSKLTGC